MKIIKGRESFYSKKLKKVIMCRDGYYKPENEKEVNEIKAYLEKTKKKKAEKNEDNSRKLDEMNKKIQEAKDNASKK